jgi:hypothetical protein
VVRASRPMPTATSSAPRTSAKACANTPSSRQPLSAPEGRRE